jgi:drug/metabolite transporter (DMT)-like permease
MSAEAKSSRLFGVAGVVMALCCLAGPAMVGAAAGAAIGNLLGIAAAVVIALAGVLVVRRWRGGDKRA